ncbi:alpha/beta fold hydrolase [Streptomyces sp. NPDC053474]|uniref:alpha/beta fold hydrolase n=1 Tax=Streptomyces sp. NPDC053474 TaxID=3365704 RepID=UPI0037D036A3
MSGPPDAPPLVLLHALGEDATDWEAVVPALARSRRAYALDLRGHGRSDWPGDYSLELMQADVLRFLDALGLGPVDLIGHSMGGIVAYLLAQDHPQRVSRLILEDVPIPRPREQTTPTKPDGALTFDWETGWPSGGRSTRRTPGGSGDSARSPPRPSCSPAALTAMFPRTASPSSPAASPAGEWSPSRWDT